MNLFPSQYILCVNAQILLDFIIGSIGFVSVIAIQWKKSYQQSIRIGHLMMSDGHLMRREEPVMCQTSEKLFTVKYLLVNCRNHEDTRKILKMPDNLFVAQYRRKYQQNHNFLKTYRYAQLNLRNYCILIM